MIFTSSDIVGGDVSTFKAIIKNNNSYYVQKGYVIFKLHGKTIKDSKSNAIKAYVKNGRASLNYTLPLAVSQRNYTITALFTDSIYKVAQKSVKKEFKKSTTTIKFTSVKKMKSNTISVKGFFLGKHSNNLIGTNNIIIKKNQW